MSGVMNAALFERLMEINSNPPILYYGFNVKETLVTWLTINIAYWSSADEH